MPKYVIERELPGIGKSSREDLHGIAQKRIRAMIDPTTSE